jgi:hypothetical protein
MGTHTPLRHPAILLPRNFAQLLDASVSELTGTSVERTNIISLEHARKYFAGVHVLVADAHLEGGLLAAAVVAGKSIGTSMGFTPLEWVGDGNTARRRWPCLGGLPGA